MTTVVMMRVRDMVSSLVAGVIYPQVVVSPSATESCRTDATLGCLEAPACALGVNATTSREPTALVRCAHLKMSFSTHRP